jgi:hypothetical protein
VGGAVVIAVGGAEVMAVAGVVMEVTAAGVMATEEVMAADGVTAADGVIMMVITFSAVSGSGQDGVGAGIRGGGVGHTTRTTIHTNTRIILRRFTSNSLRLIYNRPHRKNRPIIGTSAGSPRVTILT